MASENPLEVWFQSITSTVKDPSWYRNDLFPSCLLYELISRIVCITIKQWNNNWTYYSTLKQEVVVTSIQLICWKFHVQYCAHLSHSGMLWFSHSPTGTEGCEGIFSTACSITVIQLELKHDIGTSAQVLLLVHVNVSSLSLQWCDISMRQSLHRCISHSGEGRKNVSTLRAPQLNL